MLLALLNINSAAHRRFSRLDIHPLNCHSPCCHSPRGHVLALSDTARPRFAPRDTAWLKAGRAIDSNGIIQKRRECV